MLHKHIPLPWKLCDFTPSLWGYLLCFAGEGCGETPACGGQCPHAAPKPLPPLRRSTSPSDKITVGGVMRFPTQQKRTHTWIRPGLRRLSRAMARSPRRRPAPKDRIKNPKRDSCDGRALLQGRRVRIQLLPLDGVGGLLSPSGDLVRRKSYIGFGVFPVHRAESLDLFLSLTRLFPCQSAVIFGRPWFLLFYCSFLGPSHSIKCAP